MMMPSLFRSLLLTVLLVCLLSPSTSAVNFFIGQAEEICLSEDVLTGDLVVGEFAINPRQSRIQVNVFDPEGLIVYSKAASGTNKFAYTSKTNGVYKACFINNGMHQKTVEFTFRAGSDAKDYNDIAKKDHLKPIEVELKRLEDVIDAVSSSLKYISETEVSMNETSENTASRVLYFSLLSLVLLVSLSLGQVVYLRKYFVSKKLIN